jgi:hypothetical protein
MAVVRLLGPYVARVIRAKVGLLELAK